MVKNKNTKNIVSIVLAISMIVGLSIYGIYYNHEAKKKDTNLQYQYQRTLNDMIDYLEHAQEYIFKATVANSPEMISNMLDGVTVCTHQAESCLAALPIEQHSVEKISGFLVQLSDISGMWSQHVLNEGKLTSDEYETLTQLCGYTQDLSGAINLLGENLKKNSYTWAKLDSKTIKRLGDPFSDYSPIIYDGKYSGEKGNFTPVGLSGDILSFEECQKKAISYFADILNVSENSISIKNHDENNKHNIDTFCFELVCDNNKFAYIDVTKKGGFIYSMIINRPYKEANLSEDQGIKAGESFLKSIGFNNMKNTQCISEGETIVATYAYDNNGILCYPDTIKVKIALDNGAPVGFEAHNYLESHQSSREIKPAKISIESAKKALSDHFEFENVRTVINSTDYGAEYVAYEFKGRVSGIPVLIYIDTQTGAERDIVILY